MTRNGFGRTQGKGVALHLSDIKTSLRAFTTSTTPNANSRLFNERLQNRDANHGARLHDEPAKRPTLHLVTCKSTYDLAGLQNRGTYRAALVHVEQRMSSSVEQRLPHTLITCCCCCTVQAVSR